ncbi:ephrin type-B receptor 1-B-like isoform X2 [Mercenaria mercenaria]|uniref:ephrin type-B receptor 1-B-like isoform X2 n=1 Tax=Mercenaria mercenaria TaxID=6596 RepID=UPI00234EFA58|nr:ephrin type-B receptor 1-B-like isoform X2 [Mercenaria mercenaria]
MADYTRCVGNLFVFLIGILYFTAFGIATEEVVLLDTTKITGTLNWTTKVVPKDPNKPDQSNSGWNEVSSYIFEISQSPLKIYTSCYVQSKDVNNWLRTPFIEVRNAKSLNIEMKFTMRKCVKHSDPVLIQQCKETFNLYSYQADRDIANKEMPSWDDTSYQLVNKIPAQYLGESASDVLLNTATSFISLTPGLRGIYFSFQDEGACVSLVSIKVYFKQCPQTIQNYAEFPATPTGKDHTSSVEREGKCVENASPLQRPTYRCMSDGTWDIPIGGCQCGPGFEGRDNERCVACPKNYFKWHASDLTCHRCPNNSFTDSEKSVVCTCYNSYYRADTDNKTMPCTRPPSAPRDIMVVVVKDTMVQLSWKPPEHDGGRTDVRYKIECPNCEDNVMYSPRPSGFNGTSIELTSLRPSTRYTVKIYAENGVSSMTNTKSFASFEFVTKRSIAEIRNVRLVEFGETYITLTWQVIVDPQRTVLGYLVQHRIKNGVSGFKENKTTTDSITLKHLIKNTEYEIRIKGETEEGWGEFSDMFAATTRTQYEGKAELEPGPSIGIIVGAIVAVILCMAIAAIMIFILLKRNRRSDGKSSDIDGPYHHVLHCPPLEPHINGSMTVPLFQPSGTIKSYVDPHTYEDPNQAVREFTREIDASHIIIESVIGGGEFGDVCKGKLRVPNRPEMSVAIKTLKAGATDKNRLDFLTEASIMGQFDDPNVIFLEGVVTKTSPIMIVTEYMANGSLDSFLRKNDGQLTVIQLVGMMRGIASGMRYLSEMGYVHRDLAARNILCNESLVCKVADFGLSREVDIDTTDGAYTTKGGKIPVRWTAPEAITFRKFTSASDVWSFGVVMWEVISYGERPYWNWSNQDVIKAVEKGYRLPPPMECPEAIHQLMLDSWQKERNNRPKFTQIVKNLDKLIRAPELLRKMAKPRPHVFIDNTPPDITNYASVEEWLNAIKMERYRDNFLSAGVTNMDQVMRLTVKDLDTLGVTLLGHQKKMMNSVQTLRAQLLGPQVHLPHMQMSEGFLV